MAGSVLMATDYLPPSDGGVEVVVDRLARGLVEAGWTVHLFTLGTPDEERPIASLDNVEIHAVDSWDMTDLVGLQSQFSPRAALAFGRIVEEARPDVIHLHNRFFFTTLCGIAWKVLARGNVPVVTTLHLGAMDGLSGLSGAVARTYERTVCRAIVEYSDRLVAVSDAVRRVAARFGGSDGATVIPNAVDVDTYRPGDKRRAKNVLFAGRLVRNNGPQVFLEAVPDILSANPDVEIRIVGSGPMEGRLRREVTDAGLDQSVTVYGFVDDAVPFFRDASVFCRPSYSEGLPLTLLEAMATETPPVVTPVAGVPEVVEDGDTGLLVSPGDPSGAARTVNALLADDDRRREMGIAAREYAVENHSWEERTDRIRSVYHDLTGRCQRIKPV